MKVITFGEIMLRLATPDYMRIGQTDSFDASFGGGEANVAVTLAQCGIETAYVTRLPENPMGTACLRELMKYGVRTDFIDRGGSRLGIYFIEKGAVNRPSKVIYDRANSAFSQVNKDTFDWKKILKGADWFHWSGITPAVSQGAADCCLNAIKTANEMKLKVSVDLNYRNNLWNYGKKAAEVMPEMVQYCDIILGNEEDAEKVFGIKAKGGFTESGEISHKSFETVAKELKAKFPNSQKIIITLRGSVNANYNNWSGLLYDGKKFYNAPVYKITDIVDRVGAGDAFMAGVIYGILNKYSNEQTLNYAVAASCLKHTIHGDFNLVSSDEIMSLMKGNMSGRVQR